jgi:HrpA-like RNA helicase
MNLSCISGPSHIARSFIEEEACSQDSILQSQSKGLPIYQYHDEIVSKVRENPITIIKGATGCGKVINNFIDAEKGK